MAQLTTMFEFRNEDQKKKFRSNLAEDGIGQRSAILVMIDRYNRDREYRKEVVAAAEGATSTKKKSRRRREPR